MDSIIFRFFNVAGGRDIDESFHLIPITITKLLTGKAINIYGTDYPTPDKTCIRDYIHVKDVCSAFIMGILSLEKSSNGGSTNIYNIGSTSGYSVCEIIAQCFGIYRNVYPKNDIMPLNLKDRRDGDPVILLADCQKIKDVLGWESKYSLKDIIIDTFEEYKNDFIIDH